MLLTKFIRESCIEPDLEASDKAEALRTLTQLLFKRRRLDGGAAALEQLMDREAIESTGIGHGIAVPHARVAGLRELVCGVGRVSGGLDFMAVDREPVHLIFLICYPPAQQTTYLNFITTVARLLREEDLAQAILNAGTAKEIFEILEKHSEALVRSENRISQEGAAPPQQDEPLQGPGSDLLLLARLELCSEMLESARSGKKEIQQRIKNISSLITPDVLEHYRRLRKGRRPTLVAVEGGICQGCFTRLPTEQAQGLLRSRGQLQRCGHCHRFIYAV
jgi:PTS system nitrogen regulatory IIA component